MTGNENEPGRAFRRLLDELSELGDAVDAEATDPIEQAEGYRHLLRLLSASSEWLLEKSDTDRPAFTRVMTPWRKFIGDNPDTIYDAAPVAAGATYRLSGHAGGALYLGVTVYGRDANGTIEMLGQASDAAFVDSTGSIDLTIGGEGSETNGGWIPIPEGAESVWVRQYFRDVDTEEPATLSIERIDTPADQPPPLDAPRVAAGLDRMSLFMRATVDAVTTVSRTMAGSPNKPLMAGAAFEIAGGDVTDSVADAGTDQIEELLMKMARASYPTPDNQYAGVWFDLDPDQALVVKGTPPTGARYWGVQLANRWQESLDYVHHDVCLNDQQVELEPDGTYRIVVAATNPGVPNWLDTAGHRSGMVNVRALLAVDLAEPIYEVVPLASLESS